MKNIAYSLVLACVVFFGTGCEKTNDNLSIPPEQATFLGATGDTYFVTTPNSSKKIAVGVTTASATDRTLNITVTSPTGAVQGTHYTLTSSTVTIPAGKVVDSIEVRGVLAQYQTGRKDTLIFTFTEPGVPASQFNGSYKLLLRGPCFEGDVDLNAMIGNYNNTNETWGTSPYGPYQTRITAVNSTSATTGTITVANIFDSGWNPLVFTLDWTDPANRRVTLAAQVAGGNSGDSFGATYNGIPYAVRPVPASAGSLVGTFSACNGTITLRMQIGVSGVGFSGDIYTVNMAR
ncbi:MAG TPA: hypothetical protein VFR58_01825 [Flavisolibacter sp.]|nr:hypothetical protein [Flavisolibacter sp.]